MSQFGSEFPISGQFFVAVAQSSFDLQGFYQKRALWNMLCIRCLESGNLLTLMAYTYRNFFMSPFRIIIAEDDAWYSELLSYHLALNPDYEVSVVSTGKELLEQLHTNPAVVTLDYALPDANGSELLQRVKRELPHTEVVIVSGQQDVSTAVQLLRDGAYDYVVKDVEAKDRLWNTVNNIRKNLALKEEVEVLREEVSGAQVRLFEDDRREESGHYRHFSIVGEGYKKRY